MWSAGAPRRQLIGVLRKRTPSFHAGATALVPGWRAQLHSISSVAFDRGMLTGETSTGHRSTDCRPVCGSPLREDKGLRGKSAGREPRRRGTIAWARFGGLFLVERMHQVVFRANLFVRHLVLHLIQQADQLRYDASLLTNLPQRGRTVVLAELDVSFGEQPFFRIILLGPTRRYSMRLPWRRKTTPPACVGSERLRLRHASWVRWWSYVRLCGQGEQEHRGGRYATQRAARLREPRIGRRGERWRPRTRPQAGC